MNRRGEYRIRNAAGTSSATEILLYDEIGEDPWFGGGISAKTFTEDLQSIETDEIHLRINSPGGSVTEGIAILNALRRHPAKVVAYIDALAASAASVIAMGADEVVMSRNAEMMIHKAWGMTIGDDDDHTKTADLLRKANENLASVYQGKAGGTVGQWVKAMADETWYSDKEAVAAGLADRVDTGKTAGDKAKNKFNLSLFAYSGRAEAPDPYLPAKPPETTNQEGADPMSDTLNLRERLGLKADASDEEVTAKLDAVLKNSAAEADEPDVDDTETDDADDSADDEDAEAATTDGPETLTVSKAQWNALMASAQDGAAARKQQIAERRDSLVTAALRDGRIAASEKKDWLKALELDPGKEKILNALPKGLIPVDGPQGYTGDLADVGEDDEIYNKLFSDEKTGV
jgi:ATP-dependent protease ClpP protease subunit